MNGITNTLGYAGYAVAVVSAVFAYINRDRYKTLINDIYKPGNQELRDQLATARQEVTQQSQTIVKLQTEQKEKDRYITHLEDLNKRLPDITSLTTTVASLAKQMSTNHAEVLKFLTEGNTVRITRPRRSTKKREKPSR